MSTLIKHAYKSHNTWIYRRAYPQHLKGALGASLKQSLKTPDAKLARQRVAELNVTFTNIIREAETRAIPTQLTAQEQSARTYSCQDAACLRLPQDSLQLGRSKGAAPKDEGADIEAQQRPA